MAALSGGRAGQPAIALVGFMGAGKSTAARNLGAALGEPVVDVDELLEKQLGVSIQDYFARHGEPAFREMEERATLEALDGGGIVSLGGGAVGSEAVRTRLAGCVTVWLEIGEEIAWERASGRDRPLARDRAAFSALFAERTPLYETVAQVIVPGARRENASAAAASIHRLRGIPGARMVWAVTASGGYPAVVGAGAADGLADPAPGRDFAIADAGALAAQPGLLPPSEAVLEIAGGEPEKTLESSAEVLAWMAGRGIRRDDRVIAFGGGVVGDLAGFCAAVYQRGVPVVQIPTTLVAQVDSAYGGKTGVDLPAAKNYVGAFHQPAAVLADPGALATLPPEELAAGYAEVVKTALLAGGALWEAVRSLGPPTPEGVAPLVFDCARYKLAVVAEDERDAGRRAVLNLGHTVGHAIEQASGYSRYRHGEAVGLGLLACLRLSGADELRAEVAALLEQAGLPTRLDPVVGTGQIEAAVALDKKATAEGVGFVLLEGPGSPVTGQSIAPNRVRDAVEELR